MKLPWGASAYISMLESSDFSATKSLTIESQWVGITIYQQRSVQTGFDETRERTLPCRLVRSSHSISFTSSGSLNRHRTYVRQESGGSETHKTSVQVRTRTFPSASLLFHCECEILRHWYELSMLTYMPDEIDHHTHQRPRCWFFVFLWMKWKHRNDWGKKNELESDSSARESEVYK